MSASAKVGTLHDEIVRFPFPRFAGRNHLPNTKTLHDIRTDGNAAEAAGHPLVANWPHVRGALLLLGQYQSLHQIAIDQVRHVLPEGFEDLPRPMQTEPLGPLIYEKMRKLVMRLLVLQGTIDCPWDALMNLIRRAKRPEIENAFYHLRAPALRDGLAPTEVTTDWILRLDQTHGTGPARQSLRASAAALNKLFDIPDIAASGLLPAEKLGPFPSYDKLGRPLHPMPDWLEVIRASRETPDAIASVWQAICVSSEFDPTECASPDALLGVPTWKKIAALKGASIGVSDKSLCTYRGVFRRALRKACENQGDDI